MIFYIEKESSLHISQKFTSADSKDYSTMRGFKLASAELGFNSIDDFIKYIKGKRILDLGSGFNGLAIETHLRGLNTSVISVNPSYRTACFNLERQKSRTNWPYSFPGYTEDQIYAAEQQSATRTCGALAHALPFPDESFDVVIDCIAVSYYFMEEDAELYLQSLKEMLKVTKKGGRIRIGCCDYFEEGYWMNDLVRSLGQKYRLTEGGVEIIKKSMNE